MNGAITEQDALEELEVVDRHGGPHIPTSFVEASRYEFLKQTDVKRLQPIRAQPSSFRKD